MIGKNTYKQEILYYLKNLGLKIGDMIPKEEELSEALGISKAKIKVTLNYFKLQGYLYSIRSVGTFLSNDFNSIFSAINNNLSITEIIRLNGYKPGVKTFKKELINVDKNLAEKMKLKEGTSIIVFERTRTADNIPVCYSLDYISPTISKYFLALTDENISLYDYIENNCNIKIGKNISEIVPVICTKELAEALDYREGLPLQEFIQYITDIKGKLVMHGVEYYRIDKFTFIIERRRMV